MEKRINKLKRNKITDALLEKCKKSLKMSKG
jgi:cell division protein FtsB